MILAVRAEMRYIPINVNTAILAHRLVMMMHT
jgi:hypothetical protein